MCGFEVLGLKDAIIILSHFVNLLMQDYQHGLPPNHTQQNMLVHLQVNHSVLENDIMNMAQIFYI